MKTIFKWLNNSAVLSALLVIAFIAFLVSLGRLHDLSQSDWASWVQAVGSIVALGVAVFVMSRQNAHAAQLIVDADKLALKRRAAAVLAIIKRVRTSVNAAYIRIDPDATAALSKEEYVRGLGIARDLIDSMLPALKAIPVHELGSYKLASGVMLGVVNLESLHAVISAMVETPNPRHEAAEDALKTTMTHFRNSLSTAEEGSSEFD